MVITWIVSNIGCRLAPCSEAMRLRSVFIFLFLLQSFFFCSNSSAQSFSTGNAFVKADVSSGDGLITIYIANSNPISFLSYREESFLTVAVNSGSGVQYYTNNNSNNLNSNPSPAYPSFLANGSNEYINGQTFGTDTIRTTWKESNFDIIQDVYPVAYDASGQIVFKFRIVNRTGSQITATAQYMLDIETSTDVSNQAYANDAPAVATRAGYFPGTESWTGANVPTFCVDFEYGVCSGQFTGLVGEGYFTDEMTQRPEGLIQPATVDIVEWPSTVTGFTWGPSNYAGSPVDDNAMLTQWNTIIVNGNNTKDSIAYLGAASWGTGEYCTCSGPLFAMLFHPEHIVYDHVKNLYTPNPFPVEAFIFSQGIEADSAIATLNVNGPMRILSPILGRTKDSLSQTQSTVPKSILVCDMADASWKDSVLDLVNCTTDSVFNLSLNISESGIIPPVFTNPNPCSCPVAIDCSQEDFLPPRFTTPTVDPLYRFDSAFFVYDSLPTDEGLDFITYSIDPPSNAMCDSVFVPVFSKCTKKAVMVIAKQNDSTCGSCVDFTFTDCAGNKSYDTICFAVHPVPSHHDSLPPQFQLLTRRSWNNPADTTTPCNAQISNWIVTETRKYDEGLKIVKVVSVTNMSLDSVQSFSLGAVAARFSISVSDTMRNGSIVIEAIDVAGNISYDTISYCTTADTNAPVISISSLNRAGWNLTVADSQSWDRGIDSVVLTNVKNCSPIANAACTVQQTDSDTWMLYPSSRNCPGKMGFTISAKDTFYAAGFCIRAYDCWTPSNITATQCLNYLDLKDTSCPDTVNVSPPLSTNPKHIFVTISDNHLNANGDSSTLDEGIDSIWFCGAYNVTLIYNGQSYPSGADSTLKDISGIRVGSDPPEFPKTISFELEVTDSASYDSVAFACINAIDGAGNLLGCGKQFTWISKLNQDKNPPQLTGVSPNCVSISITATDSQTNDQGIYKVWLDTVNSINFVPLDTLCNGANIVNLPLNIIDGNKSAIAKIIAIDQYGKNDTVLSITQAHTTSAEIGVFRQDLSLKTDIVSQPGNFLVPVYLDTTDAIPLSRKNIYSYQFGLHLTGSGVINFVGASTQSTSSAGWIATSTTGGNPPRDYSITVSSPNGAPLPDAALSPAKPLVNLIFSAVESPNIEIAAIGIDSGQCGDEVIYNGGNDTTFTGQNYSIALRSPSGNFVGGTVFLKSACTPVIGDSLRPTALSIAPAMPNPASGPIFISYTIPSNASVSLELYNTIGENVRTLVAEDEQQGDYRITLDAANLPDGIYFLRLAAGGAVCSRPVILSR